MEHCWFWLADAKGTISVIIRFMEKFYRTPEEMKANYYASLEDHSDENLGNSGVEKGVRATAFVTAKMISDYIPGSTGMSKSFYNAAIERIKPEGEVPDVGAPYFIELRYKSTEAIIRKFIDKFKEIQVVELASGFTSHGLSMTSEHEGVKKWIDNDFEASLNVKQDVVNSFIGGVPIEYVPGSVFDDATWAKIKLQLLPDVPVVIFCEGLMMYFTKAEREIFFTKIKALLEGYEGIFMHEDLLKYQRDNEVIAEGRSAEDFAYMTKQIKQIGGNQNNAALDELLNQKEVTGEYEGYGFGVERYRENDIATLSLDKYPEELVTNTPGLPPHTMHPRQNGEDLLKADFKMWVLTLNKE